MTDHGGLVASRDGYSCVCCGQRLDGGREPASLHHRIHGNRRDNRPSNKILLWGTGITHCHGRWGGVDRAEAVRRGLVVSRHGAREATLTVPVFYYQPHLGRVGWYLLDDHGGMTAVDAGPHPEPVQLERGTR